MRLFEAGIKPIASPLQGSTLAEKRTVEECGCAGVPGKGGLFVSGSLSSHGPVRAERLWLRFSCTTWELNPQAELEEGELSTTRELRRGLRIKGRVRGTQKEPG